MATAPVSLGSSIQVPSAKAIADTRPTTVPSRYVREDIAVEPTTTRSDFQVPVIDISKLANPEDQIAELQKLHSACKDWGLFQLINHGIPEEPLERIKESVREFFDLPLEEKKRWAQKPGSLEGFGQAFVVSNEQKLEWNDMIFLKALPVSNRNLNLWPENPQHFRKSLEEYADNMNKITVSLLSFVAMSIGIEDGEEFSGIFREGSYEIRMNYYPLCPEPERAIGLGKHCDMSGITLLLECGDLPGLQVRKDGQWIFVKPIANALVVNIGQILEVMSNGIYKAAEHRAVVNSLKERLSVATFCYPTRNATVGPNNHFTRSGNPARYKTMSTEEHFNTFLECFYRRKLDESFIDMLKL